MAKRKRAKKKDSSLGSGAHPLIVVPKMALGAANPDFELAARWDRLVEKACAGIENEGPLSLRRSKCDDVKRRRKIAMRRVMDWISDDRRVNRPTFHGLGAEPMPMRTKLLIGGGLAVIAVVALNRQKIAEVAVEAGAAVTEAAASLKSKLVAGLTDAQKAIFKKLIPAKGEEFVDIVFDVAPKKGLNPVFVLAFIAVESGFKLSSQEYGDDMPRCMDRKMFTTAEAKTRALALPGVTTGEAYDPIAKRKCQAYIPKKGRGWGLGPMQIEWMVHKRFYDRADYLTARAQIEYAIDAVILDSIAYLRKNVKGITNKQLFEGVIAAYNAGPAAAASTINKGGDLTKITAADWYIPKISEKMDQLSKLFGGSATNMFA